MACQAPACNDSNNDTYQKQGAGMPAEGDESGGRLGAVQWFLGQSEQELRDAASPALALAIQAADDDCVQL